MSERLKYIQSLKDQGMSRAEAIEQLKIWDEENKPVEEVEKTEGVAESADVTPGPQAQESTELKSAEPLSAIDTDPPKVDIVKLKEDQAVYKRRADNILDKSIKQVPRRIDKDFVFDFGDENLNNLSKRLSDDFFSLPQNKNAKLPRKLLLNQIKEEVNSNTNISSYNSFYNDFTPITEDEIELSDNLFYTNESGERVEVPEDAELVAIRPVFKETEAVKLEVEQPGGISPTATGEIESGKSKSLVTLEDTKVSPDVISQESMLKFKDANGNVYYSNFTTPTIEAGELEQVEIKATPGRIIKPYQADASYDVTESMLVDDLFRPDSNIGRENITVDDPNTDIIETTTYKVNYDKMFDSAVDNLNEDQLTKELFEGQVGESNGASAEVDIKPGTGFNNSSFANFGFIFKNNKIIANNGKEFLIQGADSLDDLKSFLKENKTEYDKVITLDDSITYANDKIMDYQRGFNSANKKFKNLQVEMSEKHLDKIATIQSEKSTLANSTLNSVNKRAEKIDEKAEKLKTLRAKVEQGLSSPNKYNRLLKKYKKNVDELSSEIKDYENLKLSEYKEVNRVTKSNNMGETTTLITLKSPSGEKITIDKDDFKGEWGNETLKTYTEKFNDLKSETIYQYLQDTEKLEYYNRLRVDMVSKLQGVAKTANEKYKLQIELEKQKGVFDDSQTPVIDVSKEVLNDVSKNLVDLVYRFPTKIIGRTWQAVLNTLGTATDYENQEMDRVIKQLDRSVDYITDNYFSIDTNKRFSAKWNKSFAGQAQQVMVDMLFDILVLKGMGGGSAIGGIKKLNKTRKQFAALVRSGKVKEASLLAAKTTSDVVVKGTVANPMFQRIYNMQEIQLQDPAFKTMTPNEKYLYSTGLSFVIAQMEKLGIEATIGNGGNAVTKYILNSAFKSGGPLKQGVNKAISDLVQKGVLVIGGGTTGMIGEIIVENSQELVELKAQDFVNNIKGYTAKPGETGFVTPDSPQQLLKRLQHVTLLTMAAAGPISTVASYVQITKEEGNNKWMNDISEIQFAANYQVFSDPIGVENEVNLVMEKYESGEIETKEEADRQAALIRAEGDLMQKIPQGMRTVEQQKAYKNLSEIKELEEIIEGKDPDLVKKQRDRIKELKEQNQNLQEDSSKRTEKLIQSVEEQGGEVNVIDATNQEEINNSVADLNITEDQKKEAIKDINNGGAVVEVDGKKVVIIDQKGDVERLLTHEDRHLFFREVLKKNPELAGQLSDLITEKLNNLDNKTKKFIDLKMKEYQNAGLNEAQIAEELIMQFGDALFDSNVVLGLKNDGIFNNIVDNVGNMYRNFANKDVKIRNTNDLVNLIKDHRKALETGKIPDRLKRFREDGVVNLKGKLKPGEQIDLNQEDDVVVDTTEDVTIDKSMDIKQSLDTIVQDENGNRKFNNKTEFDNDPTAPFEAYNTIQNTNLLDGRIRQDIGNDKTLSEAISLAKNPDEIKNDIVRKVKENLAVRAIKNFDPSKNESLFGYMLGKRPLTIEALKDIKKEYVKDVGSRGGNVRIDQQTEEGGSLDFEDTSIDIEGGIDADQEVLPKSKLKRANPQLITQQLEDAVETAVLEIREGVRPEVDDKSFRPFIKEVLEEKLTSKITDALGKGVKYEETIKAIAPTFRKAMPIQFFVKLESQMKPADRVFTKPPTRLTKQADIDKARLKDNVYLEQDAQGVNLYEFKNFTDKQLVEKIFPPIINPKTGKRSGARGNVKTSTATSIGVELGFDMIPSVFRVNESARDMAKIGIKIQRDPRMNFSLDDTKALIKMASLLNKNAVARVLKYSPAAINNKTRKKYRDQLEKAVDNGYIDKAMLEASLMYSGGKQTFYGNTKQKYNSLGEALEAGIAKPIKYGVTSKGDYIVIAKINENSFKQGKILYNNIKTKPNLDFVPAKNKLFWGANDINYEKIYNKAAKYDGKVKYIDSKGRTKTTKGGKVNIEKVNKEYLNSPEAKAKMKANMNTLEHVANKLAEAVRKGMPMDVAALVIVQSYQATSGLIKIAAPFKYVSEDFERGSKNETRSSKLYREEHSTPASVIGASLLWAIKNNKVGDVFPIIKDGFYQTKLSKKDDSLIDDAGFAAILPEGTSILNNPIIRMALSGINLNTIRNIYTNETMAEEFGLGVDNKLKYIADVYKYQNQLISEVVYGITELKDAKLLLDEYVNNLAETQSKASEFTADQNVSSGVVVINKSMTTAELMSKAASIDEALRIANSLDEPTKKIRVFDFDDTLATSNNKVIATKGEENIVLNAEEFASRGLQLKQEGWEMDFSDFNNVTEGGRGPLFKVAKAIRDARGNEDLFVLTARAPQAQEAIYEFLKAEGLEFKRKNIIGLGDSTGEAKANWILNKAAEGYNDFYFADDAPQNVKAVRDTMNILSVKSKVQLAKENSIPIINKSISKKLNWKTDEAGNMKTSFNIGNKKYNFNLDSRDNKGTFEVEFDLAGRKDITGTGDAVKVIRTVYNGLLNAVNQNKDIKRIEFSSLKSEQSRVKLYTTLMNSVAKKLGWETDVWESNNFITPAKSSYDFEITKPRKKQTGSVEKVLEVIDVKSKTQKARISKSVDLSESFNKILEETTGVEFYKEYSPAKARTIGANKGKIKFFIPYSAEDFTGLIYPTLSKGSKGDAQMAWYKSHLFNPYTKAMNNLSTARVNLMSDFKALKKELNVPKNLRKVNDSGYTNEQAVRVFLFDQMDESVPGLSKKDLKELKDIVINDPKLSVFADQILAITKGDGYAKPGQSWQAGTITTDLIDLLNDVKRKKYLEEWQQNADAIFTEQNLNKLEALYGTKYREALENSLHRMKTGKNRMFSGNRLSNQILDYINGSIGTIMFFNTRSAILQTISSINFINWSFNNPLRAGQAFANQPQYWKDFTKLINSDYLVDRRNGLKLNINESEIADAAATSKNKAKAAINYILQKGFLPTQYADSFAIASGGATYYRNRVRDLVKNQGMSESEAEEQALIDWRSIAEESQQSSDPSKISQQQASDLGRLILAFANTPMQYARLQKRAIQDLANNRGDWKSNTSKVIYYGFVQNLIFNALQSAVFAIGFGDDDDDEKNEKKYIRTANGMVDSLLRGLGIGGSAVSVGKNLLMNMYERSKRDRPEYVDAMWDLTRFSPPIYSKISKFKQAAYPFDAKKRRKEMIDKGFSLDNPAYEAFAKVVSAVFNVPLDRLVLKLKNIEGGLNEDNEIWQRIAMLLGWPKWQIVDDKDKNQDEKKKNKNLIKIKSKINIKKGGIKIKRRLVKP